MPEPGYMRRLFVATCLIASLSCRAEQTPLQIIYDLRPPLVTLENDKLAGSLGLRAQTALERSGLRFTLQQIPIQRQLRVIEQNLDAACAVGRLMNEDRKRTGIFTKAIITSEPYVAIVRKDFVAPEPATLAFWSTLPSLRWGVQSGLHYGDGIQRMTMRARAGIFRFTANNQHFAALLRAERIDFVLIQRDEAQLMLKDAPSLKAIALSDVTRPESRYFYCSKRVNPASIRALNNALANLPTR